MNNPSSTKPTTGSSGGTRRCLLRGSLLCGAMGALRTPAAEPAGAGTSRTETGLRRDGVIVFQGDSVTDAGRNKGELTSNNGKALGNGYAALLAGELLADHPDLGLKTFNRGVSGNKVPDLAARWKEDAVDLRPSILSILIGINDLWHTIAFGSKYKGTVGDYESGLRDLLRRSIQEIPGVRLVVCEPFTLRDWPAFDPYRAAARKVAEEKDLTFVPFQSTFDEARKAAPGEFWLWDGIHPTLAGHALMVRSWRKAVGI